ncbi:hypothetical protein [Nocardia niwae]|uniref:Uncharacterized protein n=1 Tax=Nocardia niwae TaxID=626084 RepID=A0ABV2X6I9_9NOCA
MQPIEHVEHEFAPTGTPIADLLDRQAASRAEDDTEAFAAVFTADAD